MSEPRRVGGRPGGRPFAAAVLALAAGCGSPEIPVPNYGPDDGSIRFRDDAEANAEVDVPIGELAFTAADGSPRTIDDLAPGRPVVLVVTRGQTDPICPVCTTQTARLIKAYPRFRELGAEVVVVYPRRAEGGEGMFEAFLEVVAQRLETKEIDVPFPIVFDPGLAVVRRLEIESELAKPTTLVLDARRRVRYAFVGETYTVRPSIETLLTQVRRVVGDGGAAEAVGGDPSEGGV